jgi:hypothetical protein
MKLPRTSDESVPFADERSTPVAYRRAVPRDRPVAPGGMINGDATRVTRQEERRGNGLSQEVVRYVQGSHQNWQMRRL